MKIIKKYHDPQTDADAELYDNGILFIKGTWGIQDVEQDIDFWPTLRKETKAHRGATEQADFLDKNVEWHKVKEIHAHSLGGAVALILSQRIPHIPIYTYGAFRPFVFWYKNVRSEKDAPIVNYIYHTDIVPRIFYIIPLFRKYVGKVEHIKGKGFHPFTDHLRYPQLKQFGV